MDFEHTEEQKLFYRSVVEFAQKEIMPGAAERDEEARFDRDVWDKAAEFGLMGLPYPERYGGSGASVMDTTLAGEALAYGGLDAGFCLSWGAHVVIGGVPIWQLGTEEQKNKYLPRIASGEWISGLGLTEPEAGSDAGGILTTAVKKDGYYVLNGTKTFITNGGLAKLYLVLASLERGGSADQTAFFYVPAETPGFSAGKVEDKMGQRASQTAEVILEDVVVPAGNLYGEAGAGLRYVEEMIYPLSRASVGCISLGIARAAYDHALDYAAKRVQGGKPIIEHQAIAMKLANMATAVEAARSLAWKATWANIITMGREFKMACMSKVFCSEVAERVTLDAIQVLGGYGYMRDHPVEKLFRDAKLTQIYECTNDMNLLDIASMINP